ncbi:UvrD-helicase domain-containing protein, partial [Demequina sp.]|uniref:UvrD-helicase domain-containing protein n=1 Tax=Demequina sp. TaxID=2050685 RepID=UPI0025DAEC30
MTTLRLLPPAPGAPLPELDTEQRVAVDAALAARVPEDPGHLVVVGAAGAGKTTVAAALAVEAVRRGVPVDRVLVIAATRAGAARLRDRVSLALDRPVGAPVVRTAASTAHAILTAQATALGEPAPVLVTGAEQDQILRELLEGHSRGLGAAPDWAGVVPPEATRLAGFRAELRDVLMRASEGALTPADLGHLGVRTGRPEWVAAARVMDEYDAILGWRSVTQDQGPRYDPAAVVAHAAHVLGAWEELAEGDPPGWDLVVVDDAQDLTAAGVDLVRATAAAGARLVLLGNADEAVQGYRGAVPGALAEATAPRDAGGFGAALVRLGAGHRQSGPLAGVTAAAVARIGTAGVGSARAAIPAVPAAGEVEILTAAHRHAQSRAIAAALRGARHGFDGPETAWGRMAVIARSAARLRELRADLSAADIPCETLGDGTALHSEPAVAPLLMLMRRAAESARGEQRPWDQDQVAELLGSRIVGIDPVALRRLRRALVREERQGGGTRTSAELLEDAIEEPARWVGVGTPEARLAQRASAALRAGADAAAGGTPATVAWAVW